MRLPVISAVGIQLVILSSNLALIFADPVGHTEYQSDSENNNPSRYSFLGSRYRASIGIKEFDENDYYVSINPATWNNSLDDCTASFGKNSNLLSIESQGEMDFLNVMLESYGSGHVYWTSGIYDAGRRQWKWGATGQQLPAWAPWDDGYPSREAETSLGVVLSHSNRYDDKWQTLFSTQLHRYICEVNKGPPPPPDPQPCTETTDLVIVLDSSRGVGTENYEKAKTFVEKLAAAYTGHGPSRLGFVIYSTSSVPIFNLTSKLTPENVSGLIKSAPYLAGGIETSRGIISAGYQFCASPRPVPRNIVVVTAGTSNNRKATENAAKWANKDGIKTFAVGITSSVSQAELRAIAGGNRKNVFTTDNFDELLKLLVPVSEAVCPGNVPHNN